jgi:hypothetical protein
VPIAHAEYLGRSLSGGRSALTALKRAPVLVLYAIVGLFAYSFVAGGVLLVSVFAVSIPLNLLKTALSGINEQIATVVAAAVAVVGTIAWMSLFLGVFSRFLVGMVSVLVERRGPFAAFGRGWRLTRGAWVRHGVLLFLATILSYVLLTLLTMLAAWIGGSAEGSLAAAATAALYFVVYGVVAFPLWAALAVTMYVDGRVRREALDLEMLLGSLAPVLA